MNLEKYASISLTPTRLILYMSIFIIVAGNWAFFDKVIDFYEWNLSNAGFILSLAVFLTSILLLISTFFSLFIPTRIIVSIMFLLAAVIGYFSDQLGIVIDIDMIRNMLETNFSEASDLITLKFLMRFIFLGILPVIFIWYLPLKKSLRLRELRNSAQLAVGSIALMLICALSFGDHYSSFFREHKPLRYFINPTLGIYSAGKYLRNEIRTPRSEKLISLSAHAKITESSGDLELVIMVVGETARADHFSLNGYHRLTNPNLSSEKGLISFTNFSSCGTSTAISVPCMFSYSNREDFKPKQARSTENALDILSEAGVSVLWRDNNSSSKGVANRVIYEDFRSLERNPVCDPECRDIGMLSGLQEYINIQQGDILIVLHQMGSHGPAYYKRYPKEFNKFQPSCNTLELSSCTNEEITNAYDNSILYTDYFLSEVIKLLKKNTPEYETTMLYVSDHGESLGESGLYLHGMPYMFAPESQTRVPVITWVSETSDIDYKKTNEIRSTPLSHDALFNTLLNVFEIKSDLPIIANKGLVQFKDHS